MESGSATPVSSLANANLSSASKYGHRFPTSNAVVGSDAPAVPGNALKGSVGSIHSAPTGPNNNMPTQNTQPSGSGTDMAFESAVQLAVSDLKANPKRSAPAQPPQRGPPPRQSAATPVATRTASTNNKGAPLSPADEERIKKEEEAVRGKLNSKYNEMRRKQQELAVVQQELDKLESTLQKDVRIIRGRIEEVDRKLTYSRRREAQLNKQWQAAKKELDEQESLKKQLSEHLATIVSENEGRKLEKLKLLSEALDHVDDRR